MSNTKLQAFWDLDRQARFYAGEPVKPAATDVIGGNVWVIEYRTVSRKCYDGLSTPTASIKLNGKRISRKDAVDLLNR